jgi:hypothetical protein
MQTLHIYGDDTDVQNVLRYINELSTKGSEIEILDNTVFDYEHKMVSIALSQIEKNETYTTEEVLKAMSNLTRKN